MSGELCDILRWQSGHAERTADALSVEEPLEIRVNGRSISVTMRTPGHDAELAAGFLWTEGVIRSDDDVLLIRQCNRNADRNGIDVTLAPGVAVDWSRLTRHVFASSSCGLCGAATIDAVCRHFAPVPFGFECPLELLLDLPARMRSQQQAFEVTGGLHAAALFDEQGALVVLREDVGRHNAVDKVLGYCLMRSITPLERHILLVSGRASFEIVQKALAAAIPIVAAVSAPSTLAADLAERSGQTLVGFLRPGRMNVYSHPVRLGLPGRSVAAPAVRSRGGAKKPARDRISVET